MKLCWVVSGRAQSGNFLAVLLTTQIKVLPRFSASHISELPEPKFPAAASRSAQPALMVCVEQTKRNTEMDALEEAWIKYGRPGSVE
jgi:hypothetical protein